MNLIFISSTIFWIASGHLSQGNTHSEELFTLDTVMKIPKANGVSADQMQNATEYNGKCEEDTQCGWLGENSQCKYGTCVCKDNFRWYRGKCIRYSDLSGDCVDDIDCYDGHTWGSMKCQEKKCICNNGFQSRGNSDCRKISEANGVCALNLDCPKNFACVVGQCKKLTKLFDIEMTDNASEELSPVLEFAYSENLPTVSYAEKCQEDEDCSKLNNTACYSGKCVCKPGYFFKNTVCEEELGMKTCENDDDCADLQGICNGTVVGQKEKYCRCRDYWFYSEDNRKCIKTMLQTNWNCLSNEWCYALGDYSYCSSEGTCRCSTIAKLDENNMLCQKEKDNPLCRTDNECSFMKPHSVCVDEMCKCKENYLDSNGDCHAVLGAQCNKDEDCEYTENSVCSNNKCSCENSFIESTSSNTLCLPVSTMGEACVEDIQCSVKDSRTRCIDGERCDCKTSFRNINNTCHIVRTYQEYCTDSNQCQLVNEDLVCRNSKCQCPTNMKLVDEKCKSSGSIIPNNSLSVILVLWIGIKFNVLSFV